MFTLQDRPGALSEVLTLFQAAQLDLTHIESRPTKTFKDGRKAYQFRIDVAAKPGDDRVRARGGGRGRAGAGQKLRAVTAPCCCRWPP